MPKGGDHRKLKASLQGPGGTEVSPRGSWRLLAIIEPSQWVAVHAESWSTFSLWSSVFFLYVPLRQVTTGRVQVGKREGGTTFLSKCPSVLSSASDKRRCEAFMKYEVFTGISPKYQLPVEFSENKTFWWMILIHNRKPVMAIKAMILAHRWCYLPPYSWRWFYLFLLQYLQPPSWK